MFEEIKNKIKDKKLILFGEIHGTKEIPEFLFKFFSELSKEESFNVCFEIPINFQENSKEFFENKELSDGRNSKEYFELIKNLKNLNENINIFFVAPLEIKSQEDIEKGIADNVRNILSDKKTFVILGDIHASKKSLSFGELEIKTAGSILFNELKENLFSIRIMPESGEFFNFGIKKVDENILDGDFNKNFDFIYKIDKVTSCSFLT